MALNKTTKVTKPMEPLTIIKKKVIPSIYSPGVSIDGMLFAFVSRSGIQSTSLSSCRETTIANLNYGLNKNTFDNSNNHVIGTDAPIDTKTLRFMVVTKIQNVTTLARKGAEARMERAIKGLNIYEAIPRWRKSTAHVAKHPSFKDGAHYVTWLIKASSKWMEQPQLLSIYLLLLRTMFTNFVNVTSIKTIHESFDTLIECKDTVDVKYGLSGHYEPVNLVYKKRYLIYPFILKNVKEIFKGVDRRKAWPESKTSGINSCFGVSSGIYNFINKKAGYSEDVKMLQKRFYDMYKEGITNDSDGRK